jgi:hypothetical protein
MDGASLAARPQGGWSILFAREPEPDPEFDDLGDELDETPSSRAPRQRPKRTSSRKPIHWILFLLIVAIGGLFAYDPELAMDLFGLSTHQPPPHMTTRPLSKARPAPPQPRSPSPAPETTPTPAQPIAPAAPLSAPASGSKMTALAGSVPVFTEGQRVMVIADPALPTESVTLSPDPTGTRPGPAVRAGVTLVVMDGELRDGGWVYSVRSAEGLTGWLPEKRLTPQR